MRGFENRQPIVVSYTGGPPRGNERSGFGIASGARVIDSTPAGQHQVGLAELDLARGLVDRLEPRCAQPVDRHARHLDRQSGQQRPMRATLRLSSPAWLVQPM